MKVVLQDGIKDCGVCCLLSIIRFYGGDVSKEYLREITHTTKEGVSLYNLIEGAKIIGFEAIGLTGDLNNIKEENLPCIVHFIVNKSYKHFVVLYQIHKKKQQVTLMDPAKGKKTISFSEFRLLTSSAYMFLKPIKKLPVMKQKKFIYRTIKLLFIKNKTLLISIIGITISYFILNITCTFHFKYILEYSIKYKLPSSIISFSLGIALCYFLRNMNNIIRNILLQKWTSIFDYETTSSTYKQLLLLPYLYYKNRTTGEVISRFKDLNTIRSFISNLFCIISTDTISLIIFGSIMFHYNKKITGILSLVLLIYCLISILLMKQKKKYIKDISKKQDSIHSYLINGVGNVDTIKGSHLEKRLVDKFNIQYHKFLEKIYQYNAFVEKNQFIKDSMKDLNMIILYGLGSYYTITNKFSLSSLILFQTFYTYFQSSFQNILYLLEEYSAYKVAYERVEEIFMIHEETFQNNYYYLPYTLKGDIIYHNVNYKIGSKELFHNLSFTIHKGEKILLSGESGSGKSTLLKMLLRYIDVDFGCLSIDNIDINHYHLENIRSHITYVTSNEYLFTDTIENNLTLYKELPKEEIEKVCKICLVEDILKNSLLGLDSLIEENGFNFSNGEKQRIILARSLLRKSNIYIFDEAFSGIDILREKKILENIFSYLKEQTIIVISHRFNNKKLFDRVLKLEGGNIVETSV